MRHSRGSRSRFAYQPIGRRLGHRIRLPRLQLLFASPSPSASRGTASGIHNRLPAPPIPSPAGATWPVHRLSPSRAGPQIRGSSAATSPVTSPGVAPARAGQRRPMLLYSTRVVSMAASGRRVGPTGTKLTAPSGPQPLKLWPWPESSPAQRPARGGTVKKPPLLPPEHLRLAQRCPNARREMRRRASGELDPSYLDPPYHRVPSRVSVKCRRPKGGQTGG